MPAEREKRVDLSEVPMRELRVKLWPILVGYERMSWPDSELTARLGDFEIALWDHVRCSNCTATDIVTLSNGLVVVRDCKSSIGNGFYLGLHRKACMEYGIPVFGAIGCGGPVAWAQRQTARATRGSNWIPADWDAPPAARLEARRPAKAQALPGLEMVGAALRRWQEGQVDKEVVS
ncbi:MAG TPA: hypothetical protein PLM74_10220 [Bacillota bacterium]|nr:hypothetical protein [Bacillota bacterium]